MTDPLPEQRERRWHLALRYSVRQAPAWLCMTLGTCLPIVSLPVTLALLVRALRRHVSERLASPAFSSERFAGSQGRAVLRRLRRSRGWFGAPVVLLVLGGVLAATVAYPFAVAAALPEFPTDRVIEQMLALNPVYAYRSCPSRPAFEALSRRWLASVDYHSLRAIPPGEKPPAGLPVVPWRSLSGSYRSHGSGPGKTWFRVYVSFELPYKWLSRDRDGRWHQVPRDLPYEAFFRDRDGRWHHARAVAAHYRCGGTELLGVLFYALFPGLFWVVGMWLQLTFWVRLARHRTAEVQAVLLARLEAQGDPDLLAEATLRNRALVIWPCLVSSVLGIWPLVVPFAGPAHLNRHFDWEWRVGVDEALAECGAASG